MSQIRDSIIVDECDIDMSEFEERTFPVGSLIIPHQKMSQYVFSIGLNDSPGGKPAGAGDPRLAKRSVQAHPRLCWTVIAHQDGWTRIASADGQHAGWIAHIQHRFQLFDDYAENCRRNRER